MKRTNRHMEKREREKCMQFASMQVQKIRLICILKTWFIRFIEHCRVFSIHSGLILCSIFATATATKRSWKIWWIKEEWEGKKVEKENEAAEKKLMNEWTRIKRKIFALNVKEEKWPHQMKICFYVNWPRRIDRKNFSMAFNLWMVQKNHFGHVDLCMCLCEPIEIERISCWPRFIFSFLFFLFFLSMSMRLCAHPFLCRTNFVFIHSAMDIEIESRNSKIFCTVCLVAVIFISVQ